MSFTGKARYAAGTTLPELAEDVSDVIAIISPYETPLLDVLGDPLHEARSTRHEWVEDDRDGSRVSCGNHTQIFADTVEIGGSDMAATPLGLADEMDYQKLQVLRKLLRNLEHCIINQYEMAVAGGTCRHMTGIRGFIQTNIDHANGEPLTQERVNAMLARIWENSSGNVDLIVVGGFQKRKINAFCADSRSYGANDTTFTNLVSIYESDFGICRIVATRWMPQDAALFLDSSRIGVLPLAGRSFHYKFGKLTGEYTLELKNEAAHGLIDGLNTEVVT